MKNARVALPLLLVVLACGNSDARPGTVAQPANPPVPATASAPAAATLPATVSAACDVHAAVLGTWTSGTVTETYADDGAYAYVNSASRSRFTGRLVWQGPTVATITVGDRSPTYHFGLLSPSELLVVSAEGGIQVCQRVGATPPVSPTCFEHSQRIVGTWQSERYREIYGAGGSYQLGENRGTYRWTGPGTATVAVGDQSLTYRYAFATPDELIAVDSNGSPMLYRRAN